MTKKYNIATKECRKKIVKNFGFWGDFGAKLRDFPKTKKNARKNLKVTWKKAEENHKNKTQKKKTEVFPNKKKPKKGICSSPPPVI